MGYTTTFTGSITVDPPLNPYEIAFLRKFSETRRMKRRNGPYFVDGTGDFGQGRDPDVIDYNQPQEGQPGLWCQWRPTEDGTAIEWDDGEKFYDAERWMKYIIDHFIGHQPLAREADLARFKFLQGHTCSGEILAEGEAQGDVWKLIVLGNKVFVSRQTTNFGPTVEVIEPESHTSDVR